MNNSHALKSVYKRYNLFYNPRFLSDNSSRKPLGLSFVALRSFLEKIVRCAFRVAAIETKFICSFSSWDHLWLRSLDLALTSRYSAAPAYHGTRRGAASLASILEICVWDIASIPECYKQTVISPSAFFNPRHLLVLLRFNLLQFTIVISGIILQFV